jgi:hypothetical protein
MQTIRQDGLMTMADRRNRQIQAGCNGAAFGDGIYTSNNPFAFRDFGDTGILVAIVKGKTSAGYGNDLQDVTGVDTVIGNKTTRTTGGDASVDNYYDEIVLKKSCQCLPLISFPLAALKNHGTETLWTLQQALQLEILDEFFNNGVATVYQKLAYPTPSTYGYPPMTSAAPPMFGGSLLTSLGLPTFGHAAPYGDWAVGKQASSGGQQY